MGLEQAQFQKTLSFFEGLGLVKRDEAAEVLAMFDPAFPFHNTMPLADTYHLHIKVDDTAALPREQILAGGGQVENEREGYIKFAFPGGINMIFSSIDVAQDDLLKIKVQKPALDHVGIDMRQETAPVQAAFEATTRQADALGWPHASQGGDDKGVFCCHVEVSRKHWVYPKAHPTFQHAIEFAYGPLKVHGGKMGCDLRPIDPTHPLAHDAASAPCCGAPSAAAHDSGHTVNNTASSNASQKPPHYYHPADLNRFAQVGRFAPDLMEKFFEYYNAATGEEGALTQREKALIALAVAHTKQCPYCIEAYTSRCADLLVSPDQMQEAVHVAAAMSAGIDLVHSVQMHNTLRARHLIP